MWGEIMSPQAHARFDEKQFEIAGTTFSYTVEEFRESFSSVSIAFIFGTFAEFCIYKRSFVAIFLKAFAMAEKQNPATAEFICH